ncbi:hypothetical protein O181_111355 [Austropuccinia psidii MF-1]|uniref:Uncharacterized protein n=1 Tax=Austropuccinia psidii MF-1 TaxID=1389203 RepID=A0A9Q3PSF5_9BASI|nr:hypothetical protein [Austropuccinia psidii MF-1]
MAFPPPQLSCATFDKLVPLAILSYGSMEPSATFFSQILTNTIIIVNPVWCNESPFVNRILGDQDIRHEEFSLPLESHLPPSQPLESLTEKSSNLCFHCSC